MTNKNMAKVLQRAEEEKIAAKRAEEEEKLRLAEEERAKKAKKPVKKQVSDMDVKYNSQVMSRRLQRTETRQQLQTKLKKVME